MTPLEKRMKDDETLLNEIILLRSQLGEAMEILEMVRRYGNPLVRDVAEEFLGHARKRNLNCSTLTK